METEALRKPRFAVWISAFRLHTLPLALACIALGTCLAYKTHFNALIAAFTFLTAILLQILSNLANDYGDTKHGADTSSRVGPTRMVNSGQITHQEIKAGIVVVMILALISGVLLLLFSLSTIGYTGAMVLFLIGLLAIGAAIAYTATDSPYGYHGFGDISVFLFFGIAAVAGSYYLQSGLFPADILLPAAGMGLLCAAVLNVNNIRDIEADEQANKRTVAVRLGLKMAKIYHWLLLSIPILLFGWYAMLRLNEHWLISLGLIFLFIVNGWKVSASEKPVQLIAPLKQLVASILLFTLFYGSCFIVF